MDSKADGWGEVLENTFHIVRETMGMLDRAKDELYKVQGKRVVTRGSPHSKHVKEVASRAHTTKDYPSNCLTPESGRARENVEAAARAGTLKGTRAEIEAYGLKGRCLQELGEEERFADKYISPYRGTPPEIAEDPSAASMCPPVTSKGMRKPREGIIDYEGKKRKVYLQKKVVQITYPKEEPVDCQDSIREEVKLQDPCNPNKKPYEWEGENVFPDSTPIQRRIKSLQLKVKQLQRTLEGSSAVRSREPQLGAEKWHGRMDLPAERNFCQNKPTEEEREEERNLKAARNQWSQRHMTAYLERGGQRFPGPAGGTQCDDEHTPPTTRHKRSHNDPGSSGGRKKRVLLKRKITKITIPPRPESSQSEHSTCQLSPVEEVREGFNKVIEHLGKLQDLAESKVREDCRSP